MKKLLSSLPPATFLGVFGLGVGLVYGFAGDSQGEWGFVGVLLIFLSYTMRDTAIGEYPGLKLADRIALFYSILGAGLVIALEYGLKIPSSPGLVAAKFAFGVGISAVAYGVYRGYLRRGETQARESSPIQSNQPE